MNMLCIRCKKQPAVVFVNKMDTATKEQTTDGYCLNCARELGLAPVDNILKSMGLTQEQYDEISSGMNELMSSMDEFDPDDFDGEDMENQPLAMMGNFKDMLSNFNHFPINGQLNEIKYKRKLKEPVVTKVFPYLLPEVKSALLANDTTYMLKYDIISAYANGKCFNADSLQNDLPGSVLAYIEAEKSAEESSPLFDQEYYKEKIIRELINPDFISQSAYIKINAEYYYKELDSLVFNYLHMKPLP